MARYWYGEAKKWGSEEAGDRLEMLSLPARSREPNKNNCNP